MLYMIIGHFVSKIVSKIKVAGNEIEVILIIFNIIEKDKVTHRISPGRNFEDINSILIELQDKGVRDELRNSLISTSRKLYLSFTVVYLLILKSIYHNTLLTVMIVVGLLLVIITEVILSKFYDYIIINYAHFIKIFKIISIDKIVYESLSNNGFILDDNSKKRGLRKVLKFSNSKENFKLILVPNEKNVPKEWIEKFISEKFDPNIQTILLMDNSFYETTFTPTQDLVENKMFIPFHNYEELQQKLNSLLFSLK